MRQWMKLCENTGTVTLYHGSRKLFQPGKLLKAQRSGYVAGTGMDPIERKAHKLGEAVLERYRPEGAVPRRQAVFLCDNVQDIDNAGGYLDYVYTVQPIGAVTKCNLHWYSELYSYCFDEIVEDEARQLALNYWTAAPSGASSCYEYLCLSAKVLELVEEN